MTFFDWLQRHWDIGLLLTIFGLILGIVSLYMSRRAKKEPSYCSTSYNIVEGISKSHPNLTLRFFRHGPPIDRFTITKLLFLNAGKIAIRAADIPSQGQLSFHLTSDGTILDASIIHVSKITNGAEIKVLKEESDSGSTESESPGFEANNEEPANPVKDKKRIRLDFEYFNEGEGMVIQVFHTGGSNNPFKMKGEMIDAGIPKCLPFVSSVARRKQELKNLYRGFLFVFIAAFALIISVFGPRADETVYDQLISEFDTVSKEAEGKAAAAGVSIKHITAGIEELRIRRSKSRAITIRLSRIMIILSIAANSIAYILMIDSIIKLLHLRKLKEFELSLRAFSGEG